MIAEAVDTFHAVLWALAGWVIFAGVVAAILILAAAMTGAWAVRGARKRLSARLAAVQPARALPEGPRSQRPPSARTARRAPAWAHTQPADKEPA